MIEWALADSYSYSYIYEVGKLLHTNITLPPPTRFDPSLPPFDPLLNSRPFPSALQPILLLVKLCYCA